MFKFKYTKFQNNIPVCHCEEKIKQLYKEYASHYSLEEQPKEKREASDIVLEVERYINYFIFKPRNKEGSFQNCLDLGFAWQNYHCTDCWLTLKKWKTTPSFELEHKNILLTSLKFGAFINANEFNHHYSFFCSSFSCTFHHDRKEIHITLEANRNIIIHYSGIYRALISKRFNQVEVFFHLKTPPILLQNSNQTTCLDIDPILSKEIVGNSNMIKITFSKKNDKCTIDELLNRLRARCPSTVDFIFCNLIQNNFTNPEFAEKISQITQLKFSCFDSLYAWKVLLNHGFVVVDQIIAQNMEREILIKEREDPIKFQEGCYSLFRAMSNGNVLSFSGGFKFYFKKPFIPRLLGDQEGICTVRKLVMTPTRNIFLPPQQHIVNRMLRNYDENFVLQVSIKQENMDSINFRLSVNSNKDFMEENFRLKKGLDLGDRHYEFLACSNSQLREHGFWMYAKDKKGMTAKDIMYDIGIENIEEDVAKKLTRVGLFFSSSTRYKKLLDSYRVDPCDDIIKNGYNFSDGIGMISPSLADELSGANGGEKYKPSAFQIRYPGCKGMLAVNKDLNGHQILLRKASMMKFESNSKERVIDVLKTSAPRRVCLNRSLAMVLEQKGVSASVMLKLQEQMIYQLVNRVIFDNETGHLLRIACPFLQLPYEQFQEAGYPIASDPFFRTLISTSCQRRLGLLREKANVSIPDDQGRHMFGVLDEKNVLKPDEVFIQYTVDIDNKDSSSVIVYEGPVMVTRNPCHHPGDIRLLTAVDHKQLHHHLDCVVFTQAGERPLPDMMGGGDLDGDEFVVIWDSDLHFKRDDKPMDYRVKSSPTTVKKNGTFQIDSLIEFFYSYLKYNNMGQICNTHLVLADTEERGIRSQKCMEVAQQIPRALDYNKTGILPSCKYRINEYPDFMVKKYINFSYRSESVLGKLYRKALSYYPHGGISVKKCDPTPHPLLDYPGWMDFKEYALKELRSYEAKLYAILSQQGLSSFEESIMGHVSKNIYASLKGDYQSLITILEKTISSLFEETVKGFDDNVFELCLKLGIYRKKEREELKLKLASAYYMVAYGNPNSELSFPWSIGNHLLKVAEKRKSQVQKTPHGSSVFQELVRILREKHKVEWKLPLEYIYYWATQHQIGGFEPILKQVFTLFENRFFGNNSNAYNALKIVMSFFKWASSSSANLGQFPQKYKDFLDKLIILASISYTALPLSMNLEYLGFPDPEADADDSGPLSLKDFEGLCILKRNIELEIDKFETFLKAKSGVCFVQLDVRNCNGNLNIYVKARGLTWQLIYLENLVYTHIDGFSVRATRSKVYPSFQKEGLPSQGWY